MHATPHNFRAMQVSWFRSVRVAKGVMQATESKRVGMNQEQHKSMSDLRQHSTQTAERGNRALSSLGRLNTVVGSLRAAQHKAV